jgi:HD superfamily phosphohydrolase
MSAIHDLPEITRWRSSGGMVRIPPGVDVPLTERVRRLIDTAAFRRLAHISQLGLVNLVYPAANHTRHEHSLGVFLAAIEYLDRLGADPRFVAVVSAHDAELFLAAALLHDIGHSPFGHPIEDLNLPEITPHEQRARFRIEGGEVAKVLRDDWGLDPAQVAALVAGDAGSKAEHILRSLLSGPIDVDKIDYLMRDSLHAGVPYGRHFDRRRLITSLCLCEEGDGLAIMEKGKTAAEMLVFSRYVMFSEVYWHHAVRSATAMLQRAIYLLRGEVDFERELAPLDEQRMIAALLRISREKPFGAEFELFDGLFGSTRQLYKRLAQYSYFEQPEIYGRLARKAYPELVKVSERIAESLATALGTRIEPHEVLVDAPPAELEVEFDIEVFFPKENAYRRLGDISPVVRTLAREQFDDYVKRVRVFAHPRVMAATRADKNLARRLAETIESLD